MMMMISYDLQYDSMLLRARQSYLSCCASFGSCGEHQTHKVTSINYTAIVCKVIIVVIIIIIRIKTQGYTL